MAEQAAEITFLKGTDALALAINKKANSLFLLLRHFDAAPLNIDADLKAYFMNHHLGKRLFFSIQNSAHIIYGSVKKTGNKYS
jgi:hypothetical protein